MKEALLWQGDFFQLQSQKFAPGNGKIESEQLSKHTTASHNLIWNAVCRFLLMQDYDPKHTSKLCQRYNKSKEEQHVFQLISRPTQSVDLNPIELLWDEPEQKVRAKQPISAARLWQLLQGSWAELSSVYFHSLLERLLRICEAVITAKRESFWWMQSLIFFSFFCLICI